MILDVILHKICIRRPNRSVEKSAALSQRKFRQMPIACTRQLLTNHRVDPLFKFPRHSFRLNFIPNPLAVTVVRIRENDFRIHGTESRISYRRPNNPLRGAHPRRENGKYIYRIHKSVRLINNIHFSVFTMTKSFIHEWSLRSFISIICSEFDIQSPDNLYIFPHILYKEKENIYIYIYLRTWQMLFNSNN